VLQLARHVPDHPPVQVEVMGQAPDGLSEDQQESLRRRGVEAHRHPDSVDQEADETHELA
jgi:hypothetical protein